MHNQSRTKWNTHLRTVPLNVWNNRFKEILGSIQFKLNNDNDLTKTLVLWSTKRKADDI